MANRYKVKDSDGIYFMTFTLTGWVDLFIRNAYRDCIIDSLTYCIKEKGLTLYAYVIMTSHIHLIVSSKSGYDLPATIRDLKKFTSKKLIKLINEIPESRREWLLNKFSFEANRTSRGDKYIVWKEGYHAKQIVTNYFLDQKRDYIHNNPVVAGFVSLPEDYLYSSARSYAGEVGLINVVIIN